MAGMTRATRREAGGKGDRSGASHLGDTLSDKAYQAILQALFNRSIPIGAELSQAELVRMLGVTVQPLRDALRTLETEGLVSIHARSGIRFVRTDLELARSTYQFRSLIERAGARVLAETGESEAIRMLADSHNLMIVELQEGKWGESQEKMLMKLEDQMHGALTSALRNQLIDATARRLKNYLTLVRMDRLITRPLALKTLHEHLDIIRACAARDADAAEAALVSHFQMALQRLIGMA